ncbi:MAG TPA: bifunctional diaminohydroxyphosphoribosylaminopyrimidine deaminase/5-amino-6-(5-phosphoribosylamino)uracil reductase RibD [Tepidisphaeraceae bacterium]|nr:bifunctional diaminohydroxyphosphoribosylaminopyrimidine deaminase/5-amino-6-(5-phosphoribosylamino)uracil reductase RibD [Tepidisphaeraceae bacterium]
MPLPPPEFDQEMMRRAIALATGGRGRVEPNPLVACVLVKDLRVIGEGFHSRFGGPHAEPTALAACAESPDGATAYVTLEPCCHTNKKTPPCVPALIDARVARVVVGCVDPNPDVNGKGLDLLRTVGVRVDVNVLEDSAKQLISPFVAQVVYDRPYVTLKWAESADGKVAGPRGTRLQISNPLSSRLVHELRARCDAVMVGINTVLADDPLLTARDVAGARPLLRVVLDSQLRIPLQSKLVRTAQQHRLIVEFDRALAPAEQPKLRALQQAGAQPFLVDRRHDGLNLEQILQPLAHFGVSHVLVECGPRLAHSFFEHDLADRVWVIRSSSVHVDDPTAPAGIGIPGSYRKTGELNLDGDHLTEYLNPASPVFFAAEPSPDFLLARRSATAPATS